MNILGLALRDHDSSACLLLDGRCAAYAKEEWFTRKPHDGNMPLQSIRFCLEKAGLAPARIDTVVVGHKPLLRLEALLPALLDTWPRDPAFFQESLESWLGAGMRWRSAIRRFGFSGELAFVRYHEALAGFAFFSSPFEDSTVVVASGPGDGASVSIGVGARNSLRLVSELAYPSSFSHFYGGFCRYLGIADADSREGLARLAAQGQPTYADLIHDRLLTLRDDGSFELKPAYFPRPYRVNAAKMASLLRLEPVGPQSRPGARHADLAASVQTVYENMILAVVKKAISGAGVRNLCMSGRGMDNESLRRRLRSETGGRLYVPPEPGPAGTAAGAALFYWHAILGNPRSPQGPSRLEVGPEWPQPGIDDYLLRAKIIHERLAPSEISDRASRDLAQGLALGWYQGPMAPGPDAAGNRLVLALSPQRLGPGASRSRPEPGNAPLRDVLKRCASRHGSVPYAIPLALPDSPLACSPQNAFQVFRVLRLDRLFLGRAYLSRDAI